MVQFIGICDEDEEELLLVQEYVGGGDLRSHLKNKHEEISWKIRAKISYDVACIKKRNQNKQKKFLNYNILRCNGLFAFS